MLARLPHFVQVALTNSNPLLKIGLEMQPGLNRPSAILARKIMFVKWNGRGTST
jgi:hypothetical protein